MSWAFRFTAWADAVEMRAIGWMERHGLFLLRMALSVIFIWFGMLKPFHLSPAEKLVGDVTFWIPIPHFIVVLGVWETLIGVCFLFKPLLRYALILLLLHMPGALLPFFIVPEQCFIAFPFALTLEGQYIVKNLALVAAALVIGGAIRHRMKGFTRFAPEEFTTLLNRGQWGWVDAGVALTSQGETTPRVYFIQSGTAAVIQDGEEVARLRANQFVGEISFVTGEPASATVLSLERLRYICWTKDALKAMIEDNPAMGRALHATFSLDLIGKLRGDRAAAN